jgi:hypothetical protein
MWLFADVFRRIATGKSKTYRKYYFQYDYLDRCDLPWDNLCVNGKRA